MKDIIEGSWAAAWGARLARAKVIVAYPITPQTHIVEKIAEWIEKGEMKARMINIEGEHSALSAVLGAATRVRTFTATCSQGLMYMAEILWIVSGMRIPTVMAIANRALSAPINIWCDHSDSMAVRDSGWLQFYAKDPQEILDMILVSYKVSEEILLPSMVCFDGFVLSHVYEPVEIPEQERVDKFLGEYRYPYKLDPENPTTLGPVATPAHYMEFKHAQWEAMERGREILEQAVKEYEKKVKEYGNIFVETVNKDSDYFLVAMGSICGTIEHYLEKEGLDIGLARIKTFRPFPFDLIRKILEGKEVAVLDRAVSFGSKGPLALEIESCLEKKVLDCIVSLGGKDFTKKDLDNIIHALKSGEKGVKWIL